NPRWRLSPLVRNDLCCRGHHCFGASGLRAVWGHADLALRNLLRSASAILCWSLSTRRIDNDLDGAPIGIRGGALPFPESQGLELRIIKGEIADEVVSHHQAAPRRQD